MNNHDILFYTAKGVYLDRVSDLISMSMVRTENQAGTLALTIPTKGYPPRMFQRDTICDVMSNIGGKKRLLGDTHFYLRKRTVNRDTTSLQFTDGIGLLDTRVVAYQDEDEAGIHTVFTSEIADNLMKFIVSDNMGAAATDADRDLSTWLEIAPDLPLGLAGPMVSVTCSGRRVLAILQEISKAAFDAGTYVGFDVVANGVGKSLFKTYVERRGADHTRATGLPPIVFSEERGNLVNATLVYDYTNERTYIYCNGPAIDGVVPQEVAYDGIRIATSPFGRIEDWVNSESDTAGILQDDASIFLTEGRPKVLFTGEAVQLPDFLFGSNYDFGDLVTAEGYGEALTCRVKTFQVDLSGGENKVTVHLSNEDIP